MAIVKIRQCTLWLAVVERSWENCTLLFTLACHYSCTMCPMRLYLYFFFGDEQAYSFKDLRCMAVNTSLARCLTGVMLQIMLHWCQNIPNLVPKCADPSAKMSCVRSVRTRWYWVQSVSVPKCLGSEVSVNSHKSKKVKVKFSHTRYRALGLELISVYRQSARV